MFSNLLSGYRALDLTDEKGFICGKILATLGIEVIKVEPPGGDPARSIPPFLYSEPDINNSLYWLSNNTDKRSITLSLKLKQGRALFKKLVAKCDFIIESFKPGYLDSIGLGYKMLTKINPRIILTSITPFGQKGPYSGYKGSEFVVSAMSGIMSTNGDPDRPPLREGPDTIYFESGAAAALGTVMAHYVREKTGEGQQVDVSMQEVAVKRTSSNLIVWEFDKCLIKRAGTVRTIGARSTHWIWECKDGYIFWSFMGGKPGAQGNRAISKWIDDDRLENPMRAITNWEEFDMAAQDISKDLLDAQQVTIRQFFLRHTKKEITEEGLKRGLNACAINNPSDILENPQLNARDYWVNIDTLKTNNPLKRNALRANLVGRAEAWPWSSAVAFVGGKRATMLHPGPIPRNKDWLDWVNQPQSESELAALRKCIERGMPYGNESWQHATAERLGLEASLHPRGRPRLPEKK